MATVQGEFTVSKVPAYFSFSVKLYSVKNDDIYSTCRFYDRYFSKMAESRQKVYAGVHCAAVDESVACHAHVYVLCRVLCVCLC